MRWNCPHCNELVTADIDFETTKKAYVRCAVCQGAALIHPTAVLADYVRAEEPIATQTRNTSAATPPPPSAVMNAGMNIGMNAEIHSLSDTTIAPPVFSYPSPPAFLMKSPTNPTENDESAFAVHSVTSPETKKRNPTPSTIALWIAAALALGSGVYLYAEGKKALSNSDASSSFVTSRFAQI